MGFLFFGHLKWRFIFEFVPTSVLCQAFCELQGDQVIQI
jgi:hypothetical protein